MSEVRMAARLEAAEVLLLKPISDDRHIWEAMIRPARKLRVGERLVDAAGEALVEIGRRTKSGDTWEVGALPEEGLRKRHNLQGPIDDALMQSFMIVRPTGTPQDPGVSKWVDSELQHAISEWRRQIRTDGAIWKDANGMRSLLRWQWSCAGHAAI